MHENSKRNAMLTKQRKKRGKGNKLQQGGVQNNRKKETGPKREMDRTGSVGMGRFTGRPRRHVYKGCEAKKPSFSLFFLSRSFLQREKLSSLSLFPSSSPTGRTAVGGGQARRPAIIDGAAAAKNSFFFKKILRFLLRFLTLFSFLTPKFPNINPNSLDLKKEKKEKESYL